MHSQYTGMSKHRWIRAVKVRLYCKSTIERSVFAIKARLYRVNRNERAPGRKLIPCKSAFAACEGVSKRMFSLRECVYAMRARTKKRTNSPLTWEGRWKINSLANWTGKPDNKGDTRDMRVSIRNCECQFETACKGTSFNIQSTHRIPIRVERFYQISSTFGAPYTYRAVVTRSYVTVVRWAA
jgi:hypothetical protein